MGWITDYQHPDGTLFAIIKDSLAGFYVYAWADDQSYDHLQDDLEMAKRCALREFNVPENSWRKVEKFPEEIARLL